MTDDTKRPAPAERAPADSALARAIAWATREAIEHREIAERYDAEGRYESAALHKRDAEYLDTILSALRATPAAEGDGWLSIESAPRDGTSVLVCNDGRIHPDGDGNHQVVFWDDEPRQGSEDFRWMTSDGPTFHKDAFTHWRPLPPPPAGPAQEGGR